MPKDSRISNAACMMDSHKKPDREQAAFDQVGAKGLLYTCQSSLLSELHKLRMLGELRKRLVGRLRYTTKL